MARICTFLHMVARSSKQVCIFLHMGVKSPEPITRLRNLEVTYDFENT